MRTGFVTTSGLLLGSLVLIANVALLDDPIVLAGSEDLTPARGNTNLVDFRPPIERISTEHLPNAVRVHEKVISGGQPEGEAGFAELQTLGVKTVISVDGAKPDVVAAKKYGLRYVHLPHGYDGISEERAKDLAKAVRDLPGPVYIHCHHGKHRSPAAAAVACVAAGLIDRDFARPVLELAGTSENYRGLYRSAEQVRAFPKEMLDRRSAEFPEVAKLPLMAEAMVEIENSFDRMKEVAAAGWNAPPDHPDVEPAHEALILREHFTELLRTEDVWTRSEAFRELLRDSEAAGKRLEQALRKSPRRVDSQSAETALDQISANCASCHKSFRDVPIGEQDSNKR